MSKTSAARAVALRWLCALTIGATVASVASAKADWDRPWRDDSRGLVIDAYEFNPIDWKELTSDKRIVGFISKASDGLPPQWSCAGLNGDDASLCKNRWWKYAVTQELYFTRREMAKTLGLKWGAYHLGRPGNPREQADHFIDFTKPEPDELIALDIEDNTSDWMSLADAETFARQVKIRVGRYPVLYTNGSTAAYIADHSDTYPLLSRMQLWYARYRDDLTGIFPKGHWDKYALWQFSSMHNCNERSCPYRVKGARNDIDVNVSTLDVADLRKAWPFDGLIDPEPNTPDAGALVASIDPAMKEAVADADIEVADLSDAAIDKPVPATLAAAYGPSGHATIDPLKLLTQTARQEHEAALRSPVLASLTEGARTDPLPHGPTPRLQPEAAEVGSFVKDSLALLQERMQAVRDILAPTVVSREEVQGAESAGPTLRSRIADMMRAAAEKIEGQRSDGNSELRTELRSTRGGWTTLAHLSNSDRRVAKAFATTR